MRKKLTDDLVVLKTSQVRLIYLFTFIDFYIFQVVVECPSTGIEQTFPCDRWLAEDEDDHRIERRLKEDESLRKQRPPSK